MVDKNLKRYVDANSFYYDGSELDDDPRVPLVLGPNPPAELAIRYGVCRFLSQLLRRQYPQLSEQAELCGLTVADLSRVHNLRIERFSTDRLLRALDQIGGAAAVSEGLRFATALLQRYCA